MRAAQGFAVLVVRRRGYATRGDQPWSAAGHVRSPLVTRKPSLRGNGVKSSVDDLALGRGVVLSRAATTLRSVET